MEGLTMISVGFVTNIIGFIFILGLLIWIFSTFIKIVSQGTVVIIENLGRFVRVGNPGINLLVPIIQNVRRTIDMREQVRDYPPQAVITRDNVTIQIDTVIYFMVMDPVKYTYEVASPELSLEKLCQTTVRNIIGEMTFDDTLVSRDRINTKLRTILDEATDRWGIRVTRVELKNIAPPPDIKDALEKEKIAEQLKRATITTAEGQRQSAILEAEGKKLAAILDAEGEKQAQILRAEGQAEAFYAVQKAKGDSLKYVFDSINAGKPTHEIIAIRYFEALEKLATSNNKVFVPFETSAMMGATSMLSDLFKQKES